MFLIPAGFLISLLFISESAQGIIICKEDYPETHYNLFCQSKDQISIVIRTSASFVLSNVQNTTCLTQPTLILNSSDTLTYNLCNYCFSKQPCIITSQVIDDNDMFNYDTYKVDQYYSPIPVSVGIFYICVDRSQIETFSQASLCADPNIFSKTSTFITTSTTQSLSIENTTPIPTNAPTSISKSSSTIKYIDTETVRPVDTSSRNNVHLEVGVICLKSDTLSIHREKYFFFNLITLLFTNYLFILKW